MWWATDDTHFFHSLGIEVQTTMIILLNNRIISDICWTVILNANCATGLSFGRSCDNISLEPSTLQICFHVNVWFLARGVLHKDVRWYIFKLFYLQAVLSLCLTGVFYRLALTGSFECWIWLDSFFEFWSLYPRKSRSLNKARCNLTLRMHFTCLFAIHGFKLNRSCMTDRLTVLWIIIHGRWVNSLIVLFWWAVFKVVAFVTTSGPFCAIFKFFVNLFHSSWLR